MAVERTRPPPQPGRLSRSSGPGEAHDEQRGANPVREVLDQVEHRLLRPVDVLEQEDERLDVGECLHDLARGPRDLLRAPLALERLEHSGGEAEHVRDRLLLAARAQLLEGFLERVVVGDPGRRLDHLRERPVRDALAVREAASGEDARALDAVRELAREPALPDARLAVDREQVRAAVPHGPRVRVVEELELRVAAHERRARTDRPRAAVERVEDAPGAVRGTEASQLERAGILEHEAAAREAVRRGAEQDLAGCGRLLEAGREVDGLPGDEGRVARLVDDELARLDADARHQAELVHGAAHRERRACGPLGVVLVRLRDPEGRENGVAGELLDDAAVERDAVGDALEELAHAAPHDLRIGAGDDAGRVDQVHEKDRRELSLHT